MSYYYYNLSWYMCRSVYRSYLFWLWNDVLRVVQFFNYTASLVYTLQKWFIALKCIIKRKKNNKQTQSLNFMYIIGTWQIPVGTIFIVSIDRLVDFYYYVRWIKLHTQEAYIRLLYSYYIYIALYKLYTGT